jgi:hypothetical protein
MTFWIVTIALVVLVMWLGYRVIEMTNRIDDLESWVLLGRLRKRKESERQRLRDAISSRLTE